jgi:hypothetical protein
MDLEGGAQTRLNGALDPGMGQRRVLAGEVEPALRGPNRVVEQGLLAGIEQGKGAPGEFVIVPHLGGAGLELVKHGGVDLGDVLQSLLDSF